MFPFPVNNHFDAVKIQYISLLCLKISNMHITLQIFKLTTAFSSPLNTFQIPVKMPLLPGSYKLRTVKRVKIPRCYRAVSPVAGPETSVRAKLCVKRRGGGVRQYCTGLSG